jgi:protein-S-isoprenylcysteine O-methyltransferase Ste14
VSDEQRASLADLSAKARSATAEALARRRASLAVALARRRVPLGFAAALVVFWLASPTRATLLTGFGIAAAGEMLRIWAAGHLNKSREVTTSGPYRWTAHPLYVGSSVMGIGLAVASHNVIVVGVVAAYLVGTLSAAVRCEEAFLRRAFGDRYDRYRRGGEADADREFSFARAMENREFRAIGGLLLAILLLSFKAAYNGAFGG